MAPIKIVLPGGVNIGPDAYSGQWWGSAEAVKLELVAEFKSGDHTRVFRRLPNGDVIEYIDGKSWARWTTDPLLIAEWEFRARICAYRYDAALLGALNSLEHITGLLSDSASGIGSWFGRGTFSPDALEHRVHVANPPRGHARTGEEMVSALRMWLAECALLAPTPNALAAIEAALLLAAPGSIVALPHHRARRLESPSPN